MKAGGWGMQVLPGLGLEGAVASVLEFLYGRFA
jgi:hypothetical protein